MGSLLGAASGRYQPRRQVSLRGEREVGWERRRLQEEIALNPPGLIF